MIIFISILLSVLSFDALANRPFRGVYEVPVSQPELKPFSSYPIKFESNTNDVMSADELILQLPSELVGHNFSFAIQKSEGQWSGQDVQNVDCQVIERDFVCHLAFHPIVVDEVLVEESLRKLYPSINEETLGRYLEVSSKFSDEPIGILKYRMRGRDRVR